MRTFALNRKTLQSSQLRLPGGEVLQTSRVIRMLDELGLPDGFPFVTDDDGSPAGCHSINAYLFAAWKQRGLDLRSMRQFHVYNLVRLLRFIRHERAKLRENESTPAGDASLPALGELKVDLIEATRKELVQYKESRRGVSDTTLATELGCISAFFRTAKLSGWIEVDPVPRWGQSQRNTLSPAIRRKRSPKFLSARQTRHFLEEGLRGDGCDDGASPAFPERGYCYGLLLASTGMRREEAAYILDCEVPRVSNFPADGIHRFERTGKNNVSRMVNVTQEAASPIDLYRDAERAEIVLRAQPTLHRLLKRGSLEEVSRLFEHRGEFRCEFSGGTVSVELIPNERRRSLVLLQDDGLIEPLCLFLGQGGSPLTLSYWNTLFVDARERVQFGDPLDVAPRHIRVVPHTMRHTFAVRMLAALMSEGRERQNDPYAFLTNPLVTVMQLLGHANIETTLDYLYAAERWTEELPNAMHASVIALIPPRLAERNFLNGESAH